jgi:hypothetical protein
MSAARKSKIQQILLWLVPSSTEMIVFSSFVVLTIIASNASFLREFLYTPKDFNAIELVLTSINDLLQRFVGDTITSSGVVAIFWALVGLLVYLIIWVAMNFSTELDNDLAMTRYVHPAGVDTKQPLRSLVAKTIFRAGAIVVLVFYINVVVIALMPYFGGLFYEAGLVWFGTESLKLVVQGSVLMIISLHFFAVLVRAVVLRKRIFDRS